MTNRDAFLAGDRVVGVTLSMAISMHLVATWAVEERRALNKAVHGPVYESVYRAVGRILHVIVHWALFEDSPHPGLELYLGSVT